MSSFHARACGIVPGDRDLDRLGTPNKRDHEQRTGHGLDGGSRDFSSNPTVLVDGIYAD